ncbi:MAG TPA: hypothetical protein V6D14_20000 [Coleofasciculaceae cyanobacterium]
MLKSIFLTAVVFVAMTLLMAQAMFSSPLPEGTQFPESVETPSLKRVNPQSPEAADANPDVLAQPEKIADGKLSKSPKKAPVVSSVRSNSPQPPHPYDYSDIEKFDDELYGEGS